MKQTFATTRSRSNSSNSSSSIATNHYQGLLLTETTTTTTTTATSSTIEIMMQQCCLLRRPRQRRQPRTPPMLLWSLVVAIVVVVAVVGSIVEVTVASSIPFLSTTMLPLVSASTTSATKNSSNKYQQSPHQPPPHQPHQRVNNDEVEEEILQSTYTSDGRIFLITATTTTTTSSGSKNTRRNSSRTNSSIVFTHFVAHTDTMTCTSDEHARPFNNQIRGVNLGGYMVLEPWITPSLFYQFLNQPPERTAVDMYTFCSVLGPTIANAQLRAHWDTWITEEIVQQLAESGAVNSFRLPIGDFQFVPYGPYKECVAGGLDYIDRVLDWSYSNGITVLLDVHTAIGSQNGFDNSGQAMGFAWTTALSSEYVHDTTFEHWPIRTAEWIGTFDPHTASYTSINQTNIQHSLQVLREIVHRYAGHPAVLGIEPLNEPWQYTPLDVLQRFYWEGYLIIKEKAPYWKYVMHDSFRIDVWGGFMDGCPERALDTHIYQAWRDPGSRIDFYTDACRQKSIIAQMENTFGPVIVGEWSLATDNCAMWLNGFNDNLPGFPRLPCKYTPCSLPYMGTDQPGTPVDPALPMQGPYGTGMSGPIFGLCPGSRDWIRESSGNPYTGKDWIRTPPEAPKHLDDTDTVMKQLAMKKIQAFAGIGHGFFFWNFRTDLYEPQWSYMAALDRGWIPKDNLRDPKAYDACHREDDGEYKCVIKKGQLDKNIINALSYIFSETNMTDTTQAQATLQLTGSELNAAAQTVIGTFFENTRMAGTTCDFGGIAMLTELNRTITDDDDVQFDDDSYYTIINQGPPLWMMVVGAVVIACTAGLCGFVLAMRFNPRFNEKVRKSTLFLPISKSNNSFLRSSLALPELGNEYEELVKGSSNGPIAW